MLRINNLSLEYNGASVLSNLSFALEDKQVLTIFGHNGAGKSSLLRVISGFIKPLQGSVSLDGKMIDDLKPHERVELGIVHVPEGGRIFPSMTVWENLELGAYRRDAKSRLLLTANEVLKIFPMLASRKHQRAGTLSGGEKQMLAIARGLMSNPRLLMLDEPTLGLAPIIRERIFDAIRTLKGSFSIMLVEQEIINSLQISDYSIFLQDGKVTLEGPSSRLLSDLEPIKTYM